MKIISAIGLTVLMTACSGGSSTPAVEDTAAENIGCDTSYNRTMMGKYMGMVSVSTVGVPGVPAADCDWIVDVEILGFGPSEGRCGMSMRVSTIAVNQFTILPSDSPDAYQCIEATGRHNISEPFENETDLAVLNNVQFPVTFSIGTQNINDEGGYFGDNSVVVPWYQLFNGNRGRLIETGRLVVTATGQMELSHRASDTNSLTILVKE